MSYLAGMGATPQVSTDIIKFWTLMKQMLIEKLGPYTDPKTGQPLVIGGKLYPQLTKENAGALRVAWNALSDQLIRELEKQKRQTAAVRNANLAMNGDFAQWVLDSHGDVKYLGKFLFPVRVRDLFSVFDLYAINLSTQTWSAEGLDAAWDRMMESLSETPGGQIFKWPLQAARAVSKGLPKPSDIFGAFGHAAEIVKWGAIGGGLLLLYMYVLKPSASRSRGGDAQ